MKLDSKKISVLLVLVLGVVYYFSINNFRDDSLSLVDLTIKAESELGLKEVIASEVTDGILEFRSINPENISREELSIGTAYIFGYLESYISKEIKVIRVIYTVDNLDTIVFETNVADISEWKNNNIDNDEFAKRIKIAVSV